MKNILIHFVLALSNANESSDSLRSIKAQFPFEYSDNGLLDDVIDFDRVLLNEKAFNETKHDTRLTRYYHYFEDHYNVDYNKLVYDDLQNKKYNIFSALINVQLQAGQSNFIGLSQAEKSAFYSERMHGNFTVGNFANTTKIGVFVGELAQIIFPMSYGRLELHFNSANEVRVLVGFDKQQECYNITGHKRIALTRDITAEQPVVRLMIQSWKTSIEKITVQVNYTEDDSPNGKNFFSLSKNKARRISSIIFITIFRLCQI